MSTDHSSGFSPCLAMQASASDLQREAMPTTRDFQTARRSNAVAAPAFKSAYVQKLDEEYAKQTELLNTQYQEANRYPTVPEPQK